MESIHDMIRREGVKRRTFEDGFVKTDRNLSLSSKSLMKVTGALGLCRTVFLKSVWR